MKKIVLLFIVIVVLVVVSVASADSQPPICPLDCSGNPVLVIPYPRWGNEATVDTSQSVILGVRWGACTAGLARLGQRSILLDWNFDGTARHAAWPESRNEWGDPFLDPSFGGADLCLMGDGIWVSFYEWPLGTLPAGDYNIDLRYALKFPVIDGIDSDGDGKPDKYSGTFFDRENDFILHVVEAK